MPTSTKYQRPADLYDGNNVLSNYQKYRLDSADLPPVPISSQKMDGDLNYMINSLNSIDDDIQNLIIGTLPADSVTNVMIRKSTALSIMGNATNALADVADIVAATDAHVLQRVGSTLAFGQIKTAGITDLNVTTGKLAALAVTNDKIANGTIAFTKHAAGAVATQAEALAGSATDKIMTPLRVKESVLANATSAVVLKVFGSMTFTDSDVDAFIDGFSGTFGGNPDANPSAVQRLSDTRIAVASTTTLQVYDWNGSTFSQVGTDYTYTTSSDDLDIAVFDGSSDTLVLAFGGSIDLLRVVQFNGSTWSTVGSDTVLTMSGAAITAYNSTDFVVSVTASDIEMWRWNGSTFSQVGNTLSFANISASSLSMLANDTILLSYVDGSNGSVITVTAYGWDGTDFTQTGSSLVMSDGVASTYSSVAGVIGSNSDFMLTLEDLNSPINEGRIYSMKFNGSKFTIIFENDTRSNADLGNHGSCMMSATEYVVVDFDGDDMDVYDVRGLFSSITDNDTQGFLRDAFTTGRNLVVSGSASNDATYTIIDTRTDQLIVQQSTTPETTSATLVVEVLEGDVVVGTASGNLVVGIPDDILPATEGFFAVRSSNQLIANSTYTKITFASITTAESWNTDNPNFDKSAGEYTVPEDGVYILRAQATVGSTINHNKRFIVDLRKGGVSMNQTVISSMYVNTTGGVTSPVANIETELVAGDVISLYGFHDSGSSDNFRTNTWFSVIKREK